MFREILFNFSGHFQSLFVFLLERFGFCFQPDGVGTVRIDSLRTGHSDSVLSQNSKPFSQLEMKTISESTLNLRNSYNLMF